MSAVLAALYIGEGGGNAQKIFLKDTEVGWKKMLGDTNLHLSSGHMQYEYMEFVLEKMRGSGRKCLDAQLLLWNWKVDLKTNPNLVRAIEREADRALWRIYYEERAVFTMRKVNFSKPGPPAVRPDCERP